MNTDILTPMTALISVVFVFYWYLVFQLVDTLLESPKLKKINRITVGILFTAIVILVYTVRGGIILPYITIFLLMLTGFAVFYKDTLLRNLFCTLGCIIHILSISAMMIGVFSCFTGFTAYELLNQRFWFQSTVIATLILLNVATLIVLKFIPLGQIKIINQHKDQQWFVVAWMFVNNAYLLYNAILFRRPEYHLYLAGNQVAMSLAVMTGLYILIFFAIKTSVLLGYKQKNRELKQAVFREQQYRNAMIKDALMTYEVNLTKDLIIKGFEDKREEMGEMACHYSEMLAYMTRQMIYSEDIADFTRYAMPSNILREYESGKNESIVEYRRITENGEYIWVRAVTNFVKDVETGNIKGFTCIKDIDQEKRSQIEMQYKAERDSLTGLYNKVITGKLIDEHLLFNQSHSSSVLFMIDVDNFKEINDHLGHVYGDAVLCELADKLKHIFRSNDIVGRIGGDEYIAFLKDVSIDQKAREKAEEICKAFHIIYKGQNDEEYAISGSVGISIFPQDGSTFEELYKHADVALYQSKSRGKCTYTFYDGSDFSAYKSNRTAIQQIGNVSQKGFRQNRIEYIFKMLYHSENPVAAIHSALELVASHFSFERGYIFETSKDKKMTSNTFEWCAEGVTAEINNLQNVPIEAVLTANSNFHKNGTFILKTLDDLQPMERAVLEPQGIKSMFQFGIFDKSNLLGFIGFDNCKSEAVPSDTDIDEMGTICNILATFFVKQHVDEVSAKDLKARQEVMNHLDNYIYVVNRVSMEVLFMNEKTQSLMKSKGSTEECFRFFRGKTEQCKDCPILKLEQQNIDRAISEIYNEKLGIWTEITASTLRWTDGSLACLVNCTNISKQKELHLLHIQQLEMIAYVDELTGGRSYHKFKTDAAEILEKQQDIPHFLVKFDICNFKLINQMYGYAKGNEVLCCVAKALEKTARDENEIFARVANDEFIALFAYEDYEKISLLNERFIHYFFEFIGKDFAFRCKFPYGRYIISPDNVNKLDINDIFEKTNMAHKVAKLDKTKDFVDYDESMTKDALYTIEIEDKMIDALQNNEFTVYLQAKYYLDTEKIGGAEALVRWQNRNADLFLPASFVPVFEKNGFITKLDFYMLEKVCHIIKEWIKEGIAPIVVSVNFSRLHLSNVNFVKELCAVVDRIGIERRYIEIEITETVIYDNIHTLEVLLNDLHESGFTMSMDDFGCGYSSLGMLKNLPVDVIKIDRSFFVDQKDAERSKIVVGSIIDMAGRLGIGIVAEGVEEREHIDLLRDLHCDMVQGYYYSKPMLAKEFTKFIAIPQNVG